MTLWTRLSPLAVAVCCLLPAALPGPAAASIPALTVTCQLNGQTVVSGYSASATRLGLTWLDASQNYGTWGVDLQPPPRSPYSTLTPTDTDSLGLGVASVIATVTYPPYSHGKGPSRTVTATAACS
jgi:hypothetical protein